MVRAEQLAVRDAAPGRDADQDDGLGAEGGELVHRLPDELHHSRVVAAGQNPSAYELTGRSE